MKKQKTVSGKAKASTVKESKSSARRKLAEKKDRAEKKKKAAAEDEDEEEGEEVFRWWEQDLDGSVKWNYLEHNGVLFPPEYVPHGVQMKYDGKKTFQYCVPPLFYIKRFYRTKNSIVT